MNYNCSIFWDIRNLQEQAFYSQKLFWPFTVWINCSSDLKNFEKSRPSASNFKSFSRSLEIFFSQQVRTILVTKYHFLSILLESPCSSHSESLSDDMSNESNDGSLTKNEHRSLDFKLIVDDVKSGKQVKVRYCQFMFLFSLRYCYVNPKGSRRYSIL